MTPTKMALELDKMQKFNHKYETSHFWWINMGANNYIGFSFYSDKISHREELIIEGIIFACWLRASGLS